MPAPLSGSSLDYKPVVQLNPIEETSVVADGTIFITNLNEIITGIVEFCKRARCRAQINLYGCRRVFDESSKPYEEAIDLRAEIRTRESFESYGTTLP